MMVFAPAALVLRQPDLGTALMLIMAGGALFFVAGVRLWKFGIVLISGLIAAPVGWQLLHDYQKRRILTFLNPEGDPLGAGYTSSNRRLPRVGGYWARDLCRDPGPFKLPTRDANGFHLHHAG